MKAILQKGGSDFCEIIWLDKFPVLISSKIETRRLGAPDILMLTESWEIQSAEPLEEDKKICYSFDYEDYHTRLIDWNCLFDEGTIHLYEIITQRPKEEDF